MRKIVLLFALALMPFFTSANMPGENDKIYLKLSANKIDAAPNQKVVITGNAYSKKGLNCIYLYEGGKFKDFWKRKTLQFVEKHDFEYSFVAPNTKKAKTMTIKFEMVDDESNTTSQELIVNVLPKEEPKPVVVKEEPKPEPKPEKVEEEVAVPLNIIKSKVATVILENGEGESFYSASDDRLYSINELKMNKDRIKDLLFGYYFGKTNQATLASLDEFPREVYDIDKAFPENVSSRKVKFMDTDITHQEFLAIDKNDSDKIEEIVSTRAVAKGGKMINLRKGQVVAFADEDGLQGLIYIQNIKPTFNANGTLEMDMVVGDYY